LTRVNCALPLSVRCASTAVSELKPESYASPNSAPGQPYQTSSRALHAASKSASVCHSVASIADVQAPLASVNPRDEVATITLLKLQVDTLSLSSDPVNVSVAAINER
jgi:hypothetical protein